MSGHMEEVERRSAELYKAPRVSLDDIKNAIAVRYDFTADRAVLGSGAWGAALIAGDVEVPRVIQSLQLLSICLLVMRNGFTIVGESAPASPENFDAEYGKQLAYENAIKQVWPLMGFALRDRLHAAEVDASAKVDPTVIAF